MLQRKLGILRGCVWVGLVLAALTTAGHAQCETCQGRCQYGVEGMCTPKRSTWGFYQPNWRRWPEPPPAVPAYSPNVPSRSLSVPSLELPESRDEAEINPEFPHLRKTAEPVSDQPAPAAPNFLPAENEDAPLEDESLDNSLELPDAFEEGPFGARSLQFRGPSGASANVVDRSRSHRPVNGYSGPVGVNPLRGTASPISPTGWERQRPAPSGPSPSVRPASAVQTLPTGYPIQPVETSSPGNLLRRIPNPLR